MLVKDVIKSKTKRLNFELSDATITKNAGNECIIAGYANTSTKDRVGDVVLPSAFEKSLATYLKNPVLLANHDWEDPIGVVVEARVDEKGLYIKARISDTREDIKTLIREKCLRTFSIGYNELDADFDDMTKTKIVKELELLEISVVTVPANSEALFDLFEQKEVAEPVAAAAAKSENANFIKDLKDFAVEVETVLERKLKGQEVSAVCSYFIENKGEPMKTKELIDQLKGKNLPTPAAQPAGAKNDAPQAAQPAAPQAEPQSQDPAKEMAQKLDAMAQGLTKVLEMMEKLMAAKPADQPAPKPEAQAPAAQPAEGAKSPDVKPEDEDEEEMSDEECEKQIADLTAEIESLQDSE